MSTASVASWRRRLSTFASACVALAVVFGIAFLGQATRWTLPRSQGSTSGDDWCKEHDVPESICVECRPSLLPKKAAVRWCSKHGVAECPFEHPEIAELGVLPHIHEADLAIAERALAFQFREENDSKCKKHARRIQLASEEMATRLGVRCEQVRRGPVEETIRVTGEVAYDPTRVAQVAPRAAGVVFRVEKPLGASVRRGDVLALIDAADVGRAKAEFQQSLVQFRLRRETVAKLKPMAGQTIPVRDLLNAESAMQDAELRLLASEQVLTNLGLPVKSSDFAKQTPDELASSMQFLGIPPELKKQLTGKTDSSNLLPVRAPFDGEITERSAVLGESASTAKPLFVVADARRMMLTLRVRQEDAVRISPGLSVRFQHVGHEGPAAWDDGRVVWVSPAADEKTRTVPVRVDLPNPSDRHHANTFGTAEVVLRKENQAMVVPSSAMHWEGCCHIVFVRDLNAEKADGLKVFHVRKVRPGVKDVPTALGPVTEIAAGVLPGEWIATTNSGLLRAELLKNDLGAG